MVKVDSRMLKSAHHRRTAERRSEQLQRTTIPGSLYPAVSLLDDLIMFLNQARTEKGVSIVCILEQMLAIDAMAKPIQGIAWPAMELQRTDPAKFDLLCELDDKVGLLRKELEKFRFVPRAEVVVCGNGSASEWATRWERADYDEKHEPSRKTREGGLRMRPSEALEAILRLTQIGSLSRLRHCVHCRKWLYAKFSHQNFCSLECQQKHYTQGEQWKAHRRAYMKDYYRKMYSKAKKAR